MRSLLRASPAILLVALSCKSPATQSPANEPPGVLQVHPGLVVELVASEPQVIDPIAIDWGPDGKLWVVEMGGYPMGNDGRNKAGGRIRCLEDTNRDGRYDRSTLFLDGLNYPTGVMAWRKGVLVTCAPEIFFAEDTTGDSRADRREILFTGFGEVNPQHRVNGLRWGLDNWVYCANGDFAEIRDRSTAALRSQVNGPSEGATQDLQGLLLSGGRIRSLRTGVEVDIRGKDFRLRVDDGRIDPQVGQSQFGRDRDDWGNWFGCNHAKPLWHFVLADDYIRRNPHVPVPTPRIDVIDRLTKLFVRDGTAHFTSACSAMIYRDELLGTPFAGNAFVCDPARGVVHRSLLSPSGLTFTSRRPPGDEKQQREFLSSEDPAFRPTMARTGPDGALWVVDMQRSILEHPHWLPKGWEKRVDPRAGDDRGRIYRIYPAGTRPRPIRRLVGLKIGDLVAALDSPNGWQRDTAQRLLLERQDMAAVPLFEELVTTNERATCRLHALCALDGLGAVRPEIIEPALSDPHPGVRRHAVRLSQPLLGTSAALEAALEKRVADPDPQVRLQLAYTLGEWKDVRTGRLLGQLVLQDRDSRYLLAAVLSSVSGENLDHVLAAVLRGPDSPPTPFFENLACLAIEYGNEKALDRVLDVVLTIEHGGYGLWQLSTLAAIVEELERRDARLESRPQLDRMLEYARATAQSETASETDRVLAVRLLGHHPGDVEKLRRLLVPQSPGALQVAVVHRVGNLADRRVPEILLASWSGHGPRLRSQVLDVLLSREEWVHDLIDELEGGHVQAAEIDAARRQRLLALNDTELRSRAARLFGDAVGGDRQDVVNAHLVALSLRGDPTRGALVFKKRCAACHEFRGVGQPVGPDLAALTDVSPLSLLTSILDPNRIFEAKYVNYLAVTKQGRTYTGMLSVEAGESIALINQEKKQELILRRDLELLRSSGQSMMPDGFEKDLSHQDLADVIHYVRGKDDRP